MSEKIVEEANIDIKRAIQELINQSKRAYRILRTDFMKNPHVWLNDGIDCANDLDKAIAGVEEVMKEG